ncbi:MAG: phosphate ABC transporter substrate-binding protein PstS, partial [Pseudoxanthomonas sp.]|nr:phosphate ABC transporter substrate-binding protein PstS [Pseudoxanthomonas sp.]
MNLTSARLTLISLSVALALVACKPAGDGVASSAAVPGTDGVAAAGERKTAEITGAGASFIFPLVSK